jgi:hypothetical protein
VEHCVARFGRFIEEPARATLPRVAVTYSAQCIGWALKNLDIGTLRIVAVTSDGALIVYDDVPGRWKASGWHVQRFPADKADEAAVGIVETCERNGYVFTAGPVVVEFDRYIAETVGLDRGDAMYDHDVTMDVAPLLEALMLEVQIER